MINKVAMKRLTSDQRRQKRVADARRQKRVADARRQKRVADARSEKGLQLTKLYLDKTALGALLELARRYGYQELAESKAGKLDEASALVSFCLRYVVAKYNDSGQISKKCQEYYQIQQTAIHLKENAPVKRNAPAENINLYIANELNKLKLRTKSMIIKQLKYDPEQPDCWSETEVNQLFDKKAFKEDMATLAKT